MNRLLAFLLIFTVFAFAPALVLGQPKGDEPKPKADEPKAKADEPKAKADEPKGEEPKPTAAAAKPAPAAADPTADGGQERAFGMWPEVNRVATVIAPLAGIFIGAIIAIVLMGLRSDLNRMIDHVLAQSGTGTGEKKEG
jgi:hypothetical protein